MFYSAILDIDAVRKVEALDGQDDPSKWFVVPVTNDVAVYFSIVTPQSHELSKIIGRLTSSPVSHAETWVGPNAPPPAIAVAESKLGLPYDLEALFVKAINEDSTYHTEGREFCSGLSYEIISAVPLQGLAPYPNPGQEMRQLCGMMNRPLPKLATTPILIGDAEFDWLDRLPPEKCATGIKEQVMQSLQA